MKTSRFIGFSIVCSISINVAAMVPLLIKPVQTLAQNSADNIVAQEILASGRFVTVEQNHPINGQVRIVRENGKLYLELSPQFSTISGPDLQIILHRDDKIPVKVSEKDYITLAKLKNFQGQQRYEIPEDINLDDFQSVGIWCRKFNVTFGAAAI